MESAKPKLLFILPNYDLRTDTHYRHIYKLIELISKKMDLVLFVEHSDEPVKIPHVNKIYIQKSRNPVMILLERMVVFSMYLMSGYKNIYIHYSSISTVISAIVSRVFHGKTYLWHCEVFDNYKLDFLNFNKIFSDQLPMLLSFKLTDYIVTGTKSVAMAYKKDFQINENKILLFPNSIDVNEYTNLKVKFVSRSNFGLPKTKKIILFVHHLSQRKGADRLLELCNILKKRDPKILILVVGDGPLAGLIGEQIRKHDISENMLLLGKIPNSEVVKLFHLADLFIMPSRQEGFPRVLLEAMACGKPFVCTNVGGTNDIVTRRQRKFVINEYNPRDFSNKIIKLLTDKESYNEMVKEGLNNVKNYDINDMANRFIKIYS